MMEDNEELNRASADSSWSPIVQTVNGCTTCKKPNTEEGNLSTALTSLANSLSTPIPTKEDEWDVFGNLVAKKIRSLKSPLVRMQAENEINAILFKKMAEQENSS